MKVRAKEMGIRKGSRVRPGVEFTLDAGEKVASWMEVIGSSEDSTVQAKKPGPKIPRTLSEINKQNVEPAKE